MTPNDVLDFWFKDSKPEQWFRKDPAFDRQIRDRFSDLHARASVGELDPWRETLDGRLAEILVLDQFSRNMYRDDPRAFAQDTLALVLAQEAVRAGHARELSPTRKAFLY